MIELKAQPDLVEIHASGKLAGEDYDRLVPELERLAAERGALRLYIELEDFRGWDPEGLWQDVKFDATHQDAMERIAIVGRTRWEEWGTKLSKPFFKADVRFFETPRAAEARAWLREV
jgi:hypothetical protein